MHAQEIVMHAQHCAYNVMHAQEYSTPVEKTEWTTKLFNI